ncbi:beta-ketoacyl-[acyl-carrier-protein] synthase family protein [Streptomyces bottropensis]|uniref:FabF protein n=2 Tax=Streptomyces bottropensis TaxID=42235 RepID=M3FXQ7_9ACTN|nr:beta-ketoacyl-[acyl-carrier-protein] synthase family protein [Streptomyces bottropensis]EMF57039.1 fabF protein [Streptomyces bottropensis ATCC 25435]MZD20360.1 beta-ketoacyl-ACP synthase II [Streptomyces sp. SID5476]
MKPSRIVVTGLGAVTPLGADMSSTWDALMGGESGITKLDTPWAPQAAVKIAGLVQHDVEAAIGRVNARRLDRSQQLAVLAAREAWADAGLGTGGVDPERVAVAVGSGVGGAQTLEDQLDVLAHKGASGVSPYTVPRMIPNGSAAAVSLDLRARAGAHAPTSACASGAEALWLAALLLHTRRADVVIAGGTDAFISPISIAGFARIGALSRSEVPEEACRPFGRYRDGFVMSEGAAVLILEREEDALARRAHRYAVLAGTAVTSDAHHITAPAPEGQVRAIHQVLADAQLGPTDIAHVNAHATGTPVGDAVEAQVLAEVLPHRPSVTATKASTGHLLGASGALEAAFAALTLTTGTVPAIRNFTEPGDGIDLDLVHGRPRKQQPDVVLSTSFGFGGHNALIVLTRP